MGTGDQRSPVEPLYKYDMGAYWVALGLWKNYHFYRWLGLFGFSLVLLMVAWVFPVAGQDRGGFILFTLLIVAIFGVAVVFIYALKPRMKNYRKRVN